MPNHGFVFWGSWVRICVCILLGLGKAAVDADYDVLKYVDPLIGTINGGHVFAGATLPFGMAKAVADVNNNDEKQGGYASDDSEIVGFSHMHDSGTGGSPSLGNFPIFPQVGCPNDDYRNCSYNKYDRAIKRVQGSASAHPGYFAVTLNSSIKAEMTVTNHTALYRFTFPNDSANIISPLGVPLPNSPHILLDLTDLMDSRTNGSIRVDKRTGRMTGYGTFSPSFGTGTYNLFYCADFQGLIRSSGVWYNGVQATDVLNDLSVSSAGRSDTGHPDEHPNLQLPLQAANAEARRKPAGGWVQFKPSPSNQIMARVGLSFMNSQQACRNAQQEIPDFGFEKVRSAAEGAWRTKLEVIKVDTKGVSAEMQTVFWSGTYRSMISPQDYTGENPLWRSKEPYYDSYYCIWDSFRSIHPLLTILDPQSQTLMVRSLIDIYRHEGKLPDCRMSLCKGWTQGGSNADIVLADAYLKNITAGVDWATGYRAVVSDAEIEPRNWDIEGRGGLKSWKKLGYIPFDDDNDPYFGTHTRSVSRTVEYAYNDFAIAQMAKRMGLTADAAKYLKRSANWKNQFKANQKSHVSGTTDHPDETVDTGFVGFLQPRYSNGTFGFQDPAFCSPLLEFTSCYLNSNGHETYEGSSWMYTFFVPQDMATLITTLGGPQHFTDRLSYLHTSGLLYIGDEQAFLPVFQFHYAGRPGLSAKFSHFYIPSQFNASTNGIAGNDDSGAMGSFTTLAMMGLWPVAGQNVYLITPPYFPEIWVTNPQTGKTATVRNVGFDASYGSIYIQSATLDGKPWTRSWITHSFWVEGGVLELTLGPNESDWGTREADLPPSSSTRWKDFY